MSPNKLIVWVRRQIKKQGHVGGLNLFGQLIQKVPSKVSNDQLLTILIEASDDPGIHVTEYKSGKNTDQLYYYNPNKKKQ